MRSSAITDWSTSTTWPARSAEIGRVVRRDGCLYVAVPDASTVTDRSVPMAISWRRPRERVPLRAGAGSHHRRIDRASVGRDTGPSQFAGVLSGSRFDGRPSARGGLDRERKSRFIALLTWFLRNFDDVFSTRAGVYGWALYFGRVPSADRSARVAECLRPCGHASSEARLLAESDVRRSFLSGDRIAACSAASGIC